MCSRSVLPRLILLGGIRCTVELRERQRPPTSLLYPSTTMNSGGEMLEQFCPKSHRRTRGGGHRPPFFIPEESWWHEQASSILRRAYCREYRLDNHPTPWKALHEHLNHFFITSCSYFGKRVAESLPVSPLGLISSCLHTTIILFSTIVIEYARIHCQYLSDSNQFDHALYMATLCSDVQIRHFQHDYSQGPCRTAMVSAGRGHQISPPRSRHAHSREGEGSKTGPPAAARGPAEA